MTVSFVGQTGVAVSGARPLGIGRWAGCRACMHGARPRSAAQPRGGGAHECYILALPCCRERARRAVWPERQRPQPRRHRPGEPPGVWPGAAHAACAAPRAGVSALPTHGPWPCRSSPCTVSLPSPTPLACSPCITSPARAPGPACLRRWPSRAASVMWPQCWASPSCSCWTRATPGAGAPFRRVARRAVAGGKAQAGTWAPATARLSSSHPPSLPLPPAGDLPAQGYLPPRGDLRKVRRARQHARQQCSAVAAPPDCPPAPTALHRSPACLFTRAGTAPWLPSRHTTSLTSTMEAPSAPSTRRGRARCVCGGVCAGVPTAAACRLSAGRALSPPPPSLHPSSPLPAPAPGVLL